MKTTTPLEDMFSTRDPMTRDELFETLGDRIESRVATTEQRLVQSLETLTSEVRHNTSVFVAVENQKSTNDRNSSIKMINLLEEIYLVLDEHLGDGHVIETPTVDKSLAKDRQKRSSMVSNPMPSQQASPSSSPIRDEVMDLLQNLAGGAAATALLGGGRNRSRTQRVQPTQPDEPRRKGGAFRRIVEGSGRLSHFAGAVARAPILAAALELFQLPTDAAVLSQRVSNEERSLSAMNLSEKEYHQRMLHATGVAMTDLVGQRGMETGGVIGGGYAGATIGGSLGSIVGPVGTVIGGAIGGAIGMTLGSEAARSMWAAINDTVSPYLADTDLGKKTEEWYLAARDRWDENKSFLENMMNESSHLFDSLMESVYGWFSNAYDGLIAFGKSLSDNVDTFIAWLSGDTTEPVANRRDVPKEDPIDTIFKNETQQRAAMSMTDALRSNSRMYYEQPVRTQPSIQSPTLTNTVQNSGNTHSVVYQQEAYRPDRVSIGRMPGGVY